MEEIIAQNSSAVDLERIAQGEAQAFERFKLKYHREVPEPEKPSALSIKNIGVMFWVMVIQSAFAVLLAAMRTQSMFNSMALAGGSNPASAGIEAFASVFTVEFGLVVFAARLALKKKGQGELLGIEMQSIWIWVAIGVMLLMSSVAGIGQSMSIIENLPPSITWFIQWALALIMGLGASFVAFVSGHLLGEQLADVISDFDQSRKQYKEDRIQYDESMRQAWVKSDEYAYVRSGLETDETVTTVRSLRRHSRKSSERTANDQRTPRTNTPNVPEKTQRIIDYIADTLRTTGQLPEVHRMVAELGCAKSTASELRKDWGTVAQFMDAVHQQDGRSPQLDEIVVSCGVSKAVGYGMSLAWQGLQAAPVPAPVPADTQSTL